MQPITVVIPVGPDPVYLEWLPECIDSVMNQTYPPKEILIIFDGFLPSEAQLPLPPHPDKDGKVDWGKREMFGVFTSGGYVQTDGKIRYTVIDNNDAIMYFSFWLSPWNVGVADAFNFGVALADNNLVFMLGSDDKMMPTCLEECAKAYDKHQIEGWYNVTIETSSGEQMWIPNNTAMVTKELWNWTGGFGPSAFAGPDAWLLSILMKHAPERIIQVQQGTPLCWLREHNQQDTKKTAWVFGDEMVSIRNKETERWKPKNDSNS